MTRWEDSPLDKAKGYEVVWAQVKPIFEVARPIANVTFVYLIGEEDDGPLKIGYAKNPVDRLRKMQTGNPRRLRVEWVLVGDMPLEKLLHEFWEPYAIKSAAKAGKPDSAPGTEWFQPEIREELAPILESAVKRQVEFLDGRTEDINPRDLEQCVRDAHKEHDFVLRKRDEVLLLGNQGDVVNQRPSRL